MSLPPIPVRKSHAMLGSLSMLHVGESSIMSDGSISTVSYSQDYIITIVDSKGDPLPSPYSVVQNLAIKFDRGDAVVIKAGRSDYNGHTVRISKDAVGVVLDKETAEVGDKLYRVYRVLIGLEKLLVFEEFLESAQ